jgi:mannose-6-phosphate isomerase-like protein (cupin superfamily)
MEAVKNADHLYEVERRVRHAERPGFRISELQISPSQAVPWHCHTRITDTFYVIEGRIKLLLLEPEEEVFLAPGETYAVYERRPHRVENAGATSATFLVLQGVGEYDYVPLNI